MKQCMYVMKEFNVFSLLFHNDEIFNVMREDTHRNYRLKKTWKNLK